MDDTFESKDIIDLIPLDKATEKVAGEIIREEDINKVQDLTHLFNLNQAKKNVIRVMKLNKLLDQVSDQMIERFEKRPGEFSNNDLLNYMNVVQASIDRANKQLNLVDEAPQISLTQVNVNVEDSSLGLESRMKITEAVNKLLQMSKKLNIDVTDNKEDTVEIIQEPIENTDMVEDKTVLNNNNTNILKDEEEN